MATTTGIENAQLNYKLTDEISWYTLHFGKCKCNIIIFGILYSEECSQTLTLPLPLLHLRFHVRSQDQNAFSE